MADGKDPALGPARAREAAGPSILPDHRRARLPGRAGRFCPACWKDLSADCDKASTPKGGRRVGALALSPKVETQVPHVASRPAPSARNHPRRAPAHHPRQQGAPLRRSGGRARRDPACRRRNRRPHRPQSCARRRRSLCRRPPRRRKRRCAPAARSRLRQPPLGPLQRGPGRALEPAAPGSPPR